MAGCWCGPGFMVQQVGVVSPEDRARFAAVTADHNRPLKHVQRARIVPLSAECLPVLEVARRAAVSRPANWRWQLCDAEQGVGGLLRDKIRAAPVIPFHASSALSKWA